MSEATIKLTIENPGSIREQVYNKLKSEILNGRIPPSTRVVETRLATQIGTSRTPVREALHTLEREGLIESIHRVGYQVKAIKWEEVEEISEIRKVNETLAARWAIDRMTLKDLRALERNIACAEAEIQKGNPQSFVEYDAEFHEIIARISGSQRLLELCQTLRRHMLRYRIEGLYHQEPAMRGVQGHRRILAVLRQKDKLAIKEAVHAHIEQSKIDIQRFAFKEKSKENEELSRGQSV